MASINVLGLDHVVLRVSDEQRAVGWYVAVLNASVERVLPSVGLTQLRVGASLIDLVDVKGPIGRAAGPPPEVGGRNLDHYCLQLAEFDEEKIAAHLKRHGVEPGKVESRYGARGHGPSMYVTDPDGNIVELKGPPDSDQTETRPDAIWPSR
jgi:glyoxylase I family protein